MLRFDTPPARLRTIACLEGVSYVLLLFVAMPLKYLAGQPLAVRVVGSIHGLLFLWLAALVLLGLRRRGRTLGWAARIGVASLLPLGTFAIDARLRREDEAWRLAHGSHDSSGRTSGTGLAPQPSGTERQ